MTRLLSASTRSGPANRRRNCGHPAAASASVAKVTVRLSARRQTATARAGHAAGNCPPHPVEDTNLDRQPGEYDTPSNRVLPGPGLVSTHRPPVPAKRRPALHREPTPPRACATPRPSRTRAADRHAPRICHAERHLTSGVAGPGTCPHARVLGQSYTPVMPPAPSRRAPVTSPGPRAHKPASRRPGPLPGRDRRAAPTVGPAGQLSGLRSSFGWRTGRPTAEPIAAAPGPGDRLRSSPRCPPSPERSRTFHTR